MSKELINKEFRVHWSVTGINTMIPLYREYKGINLTEEDVREHHIRTILRETNQDYNKHGIIIVPKHIKIHEITDVTNE